MNDLKAKNIKIIGWAMNLKSYSNENTGKELELRTTVILEKSFWVRSTEKQKRGVNDYPDGSNYSKSRKHFLKKLVRKEICWFIEAKLAIFLW